MNGQELMIHPTSQCYALACLCATEAEPLCIQLLLITARGSAQHDKIQHLSFLTKPMRWEMQRQGDENRDKQETENTKKKKQTKKQEF